MNRFFVQLVFLVSSATCAITASANDLTGTSWRLVEIQSMDDSVDVPEDTTKYTLEFLTDSMAAMQADCNRGSGEWTSDSPSELRFGIIASTQAMCPSGSLPDKYLAQLERVRSYRMKDESLFLATMADGAIIEFAPLKDTSATATVLGEELSTTDADELQKTIVSRLFDQYAAERGIEATTVEIDTFLKKMRQSEAEVGTSKRDTLTPEATAEIETMESGKAIGLIRQWKINKALYEQYSGRIIYQQSGLEPIDAYLQFLKQRQSEGGFAIHNQAMEEGFWTSFTDASLHEFLEPGSSEEADAFSVPPWDQEQ
ncbi:META domain-containing protein [Falsihalocynthiibacter arcticus]|uniref:DUF306 domain-containing protein n=1 Tax=Falsihalocynthiibacter arcticus TaxID=1579316 RepID=A0A126V1G6_9RHOB|nr:META domain-containing protein [Falsihalocynthiibacter arcticus]AML52161.1 hypothetical protein RC74_13560 [Falsihalocynthiibacter arcticus]